MTTELNPVSLQPAGVVPQELTLAAVSEMLADCLALDVEEVRPESRFFEDLGGESIDLIDLSFQFERVFQIRSAFKAFQSKEVFDRDESGEFTPAAVALMESELAYLELGRRFAEAGTRNPRDLLTTEMIYLMLEHAKAHPQ